MTDYRPAGKALCASATRRAVLVGGLAGGAAALALPACRASDRPLDAQVVVLGAGLAGLYAAMLLQDEGRDVLVVEAADRIGGRMFTLDHEDGQTEGGGQQIGASYARVLDVADRLGVALYTEEGRGPGTSHYLGGRWQDGAVEVPEFPRSFQQTPPSSVLFRLLADTPGLASADGWWEADPALDVSAESFLAARGFDAPARALVERSLNANSLATYSMLNLHRTWRLYQDSAGMGPTRYVEGGSQRLPEAMAASLARPVALSEPVLRITQTARHAEVVTAKRTLRCEHVVCALPFPALRTIGFASANPARAEAIAALPYTQIVQHHFRTVSPFWEADGLSPSQWTDAPTERLFAGTGRKSELTGFHRGWINGEGCGAPEAASAQSYLDTLARLRPATQGALTPLASVRWTRDNALAGGAYYHWAPGQARRWAGAMGEPEGRIHFAGEHLGMLHTGMEAAMESAETASLVLIEA